MSTRLTVFSALLLAGCTGAGDPLAANNAGSSAATATSAAQADGRPFAMQTIAQFAEPWAMAFLPGSNQALITEKQGRLKLWTADGPVVDVSGVPAVDYGGQGGLGDVVLHPDFDRNGMVYLSFVEAGDGDTRGAAVGRGRLVVDGDAPRLEDFQVIWRQAPKVTGRGHFGHRLAFGPDGKLWISSGDRQKFDPAQDMSGNLGKIVRLNDDGSVPADNPFAARGGVAAQVWSLGHRNPLGIAFDAAGNLWAHEMGPAQGDELNLIARGRNFGWPTVSNGDHYDGRPIPDHDTRPNFEAPKVSWVPAISPAGMIIYSGDQFPAWRGSAFIGGLSGQNLVRVAIDGTNAREAERWDMGRRIREVEQGPDGSIYLLVDQRRGSGGELLRLSPPR